MAKAWDTGVSAAAALKDPVRRALYEYVASRAAAVGRDEAARAVGVGRSTAAFHLDRLAGAGLVEVEYARPPGRRGPGAGRPAKLYRRTESEVSLSLPPRRYDLAAELLAQAVESAAATGQDVREALHRLSAECGRAAGEGAATVVEAVERLGFAPVTEPTGETVMSTCPFHRLAQRHTELVCGATYHLVSGAADAVGDGARVRSEPGAGRCCVRILPPEPSGTQD